jgi:hypothetical protein
VPSLLWGGGDNVKLFAARNIESTEVKYSKLFTGFVFLAIVGFFAVNRLAGFKAGWRRKSKRARDLSPVRTRGNGVRRD